jgi:hypothetical protein
MVGCGSFGGWGTVIFGEGDTTVDSALHAELLLHREVSDELEDQLVAMFRGFGFSTECRRELAYRGAAELGWVALAALPLHAFLSGIASEAIRDVYVSVKKLAARKTRNNGQPAVSQYPLVLQDAGSGLQIILEDDLPIEAYQQLIKLDLTAYRIGPLHYDRHRRAWRSELDEATG